MSIEYSIAQFMMGDISEDVALARVAVNAGVTRVLFCRSCGATMDQRTAQCVESDKGPVTMLCKAHHAPVDLLQSIATQHATKIEAHTWDGTTAILPEITEGFGGAS